MASHNERNGQYRVMFRYHGKQRSFSLGRVTAAEAKAKTDQVDYLLMRLEQGLLSLPPGADIVTFLTYDGSIPDSKVATEKHTLATLRDRYLETNQGSLEYHSLRGIKRHFGHLVKHFGPDYPIRELSLADLQTYVNKRAKDKGRRGKLLATTIKKEIVTLRTAWNWGVPMEIVEGKYPYKGLRYTKEEEKPPFQTRSEIESQIPGLAPEKVADLWAALYLTLPEVDELLAYTKRKAKHAWIYPMVATAAHTGARKAELLRMRISDVNFVTGVVSIHERKRTHGRRTIRKIPLSATLAGVLKEWLAVHPGGSLLFAQSEIVERSKTRSRTTGHKAKNRPTTVAGRKAAITTRSVNGPTPLTEHEAHWHFKQTLSNSKWEVITGFHVLRHAFIGVCASKGIDQRFIDEWVGHCTEEQRKRYRHLAPSSQADALKSAFD